MLSFFFIVTVYLLEFGQFFTVESDHYPSLDWDIVLHQYIFRIVFTYLNNLIKYCGPQTLHLF